MRVASLFSSNSHKVSEYFQKCQTAPFLCLNFSHLLLLSLLSVLVLLPAPSSCLPLADLLGLLPLVKALLVDAESQTGNKGKDHDHNGSYGPHGHWREEEEEGEKGERRVGAVWWHCLSEGLSFILRWKVSTPTQVLYSSTGSRYWYFPWIFPFSATFYMYSIIFLRQILYFLLH